MQENDMLESEDTLEAPADDDSIRTLVTRLARPHASGGQVIERAAIFAEGADSTKILAWIADHDGRPEELASLATGRGLHGKRLNDRAAQVRKPLRYVLPPGALT